MSSVRMPVLARFKRKFYLNFLRFLATAAENG